VKRKAFLLRQSDAICELASCSETDFDGQKTGGIDRMIEGPFPGLMPQWGGALGDQSVPLASSLFKKKNLPLKQKLLSELRTPWPAGGMVPAQAELNADSHR